jgi:gamma-glutamyl-gamma-aminobutyrate hydrolase PuuD
MTRKIYVVGGATSYANWMEGQVVNHLQDCDLVVFTGGADVDPSLYLKDTHPQTLADPTRDQYEALMFQKARKYNKKLIGICRGAQFLCVMAGGSLVQHSYHPSTHLMETEYGSVRVTSSHHQRQYPYNSKHVNFKLIGWCNNLSPFNEGESRLDDLSGKPEVEIATYPDINALAIQSHPEWAFHSSWKDYIKFCRDLLEVHMGSKVKVYV